MITTEILGSLVFNVNNQAKRLFKSCIVLVNEECNKKKKPLSRSSKLQRFAVMDFMLQLVGELFVRI